MHQVRQEVEELDEVVPPTRALVLELVQTRECYVSAEDVDVLFLQVGPGFRVDVLGGEAEINQSDGILVKGDLTLQSRIVSCTLWHLNHDII